MKSKNKVENNSIQKYCENKIHDVYIKLKRRKASKPIDKLMVEFDINFRPTKIKKADSIDELACNVDSLMVGEMSKQVKQNPLNKLLTRIDRDIIENQVFPLSKLLNFELKEKFDNVHKIEPKFNKKVQLLKNFSDKAKQNKLNKESLRHKNDLHLSILRKRNLFEMMEKRENNLKLTKDIVSIKINPENILYCNEKAVALLYI